MGMAPGWRGRQWGGGAGGRAVFWVRGGPSVGQMGKSKKPCASRAPHNKAKATTTTHRICDDARSHNKSAHRPRVRSFASVFFKAAPAACCTFVTTPAHARTARRPCVVGHACTSSTGQPPSAPVASQPFPVAQKACRLAVRPRAPPLHRSRPTPPHAAPCSAPPTPAPPP